MSDSVPKEGDKNYKKKRTIKLDGFENDPISDNYYDAMSDRLDYLGKISIFLAKFSDL